MSGPLGYVALVVADVAVAAAALEQAFGLRRAHAIGWTGRDAIAVFPVGASALALFAPGDPRVDGTTRPGVHHIALTASDLGAAGDTVVAAGLRVVGTAPSLHGRARLVLDPADTAGVRTCFVEALPAECPAAVDIERLDHIGVASADNRTAIDAFVTRLGYALESTQTDTEVQIAVESFTSDKYGVVHHARPPSIVGGLRVAFVTVGDCELEFLQDFDPAADAGALRGGPGTTRQDRGAIARFVAARGPGLHHIALKVKDIDAALARVEQCGLRVIDRVGRPGSRRARIGFVHPSSLGGVLVHLVERATA